MFSYHGGMLWIDYINTEVLHQGQVQDQIRHLHDLIEWMRQSGEVPWIERIEELLKHISTEEAAQLLTDLQRLRQELRDLANDGASRGIVSEFSVTEINRRLESIRGAWRITQTEDGRNAVFEPESQPASLLQWPILQSIMIFLSEKNEQRLKPCDNHACIQYFYDTSKNSTRRWCRMDVCGNREKARRHYRKRTVD